MLCVCRNFYFSDLDDYHLVLCEVRNQKDALNYVIASGFEPIKILKLNSKKENKIFASYALK